MGLRYGEVLLSQIGPASARPQMPSGTARHQEIRLDMIVSDCVHLVHLVHHV